MVDVAVFLILTYNYIRTEITFFFKISIFFFLFFFFFFFFFFSFMFFVQLNSPFSNLADNTQLTVECDSHIET